MSDEPKPGDISDAQVRAAVVTAAEQLTDEAMHEVLVTVALRHRRLVQQAHHRLLQERRLRHAHQGDSNA